MIKILHIIPTLSGGGAERQLGLLSQYGAEHNWKIHIACRRVPESLGIFSNENIIIHNLGDYRSLDPRLFWSTYKLVKKLNPDIVQTWLLQMDIIGGVIAILKSVPWVLTERSSKALYKNYFLLSKLRLLLGKWSSYVIANSKQGVTYWDENCKQKGNIIYIPNIVDVKSIISTIESNKLEQNEEDKIILSVGRLIKSKGFDKLIKAISIHSNKNNIKALIIGDGPEKSHLEELIRKLNLNGIISIIPYQENWWGYLKNATALVSMSKFEGMPNVILEGMAANCPLIVSDIIEHRDLLGDDASLFVHPDSHQELANSIQMLFNESKDTLDRIRKAQSIVSKLNIETIGKSYEFIYKQIINKQCVEL